MSAEQSGPPYAPTVAQLGGTPAVLPDVPVSAVFLVLYIISAATNMTILQVNLRRGHKFIISGVLFGFSMARITTLVLRIAWANRQDNVRLSLAANILVNAGILLVYIVNLLFAQRILRAKQPPLGWHTALRVTFRTIYVCIAAALILIITTVVLNAYTLDPYTKLVCRDAMLAATTFLLVITTLPLILMAVAHWLPGHPEEETFGYGSVRSKTIVLTISTLLCMTIAGFKTGANWMPARPASDPAWYHGKAAFYVFNFGLEILVLIVLVSTRIDKRFHIPNGSKQPGDYAKGQAQSLAEKEAADARESEP